MGRARTVPTNGSEPDERWLARTLARFTLAGRDFLIVPLDGEVAATGSLVGDLRLGGRRYGILVCRHGPEPLDPIERLTPRELEIATLIACGCCDKEVARRLGISCHTVGAHIARCFAKLDLHKRTELAACIARRIQTRVSAGGRA